MAFGKISVEVEGGELIALGNGCQFNKEGYLNTYTDTYFGKVLAIIKTDCNSDKVIIKAIDGIYNNELAIFPKR